MPTEYRVWLDDGQATPPIGKEPGEKCPENPIRRSEPRSLGIPLQDLELVTEGNVLQGELSAGSQRCQEQKQDVFEHNRGYRRGMLSR